MKNYLLIALFILSSHSVLATTQFNELFELNINNFSGTANRVASHHAGDSGLSPREIKTELEALDQNIEAIIKTDPDNPALWFLKGLNHSNLASFFDSQKDSKNSNLHIRKKDQAYNKAIQLDRENTPHLSPSMYATMKHGLPESLKIKAIQKELALGGNGENESYYWHLHWSNVSALEQAERFEEAQQALENMKREMKQQNVTNLDYQEIVMRAQKSIDDSKNKPTPRPAPTPPKKPPEKEKTDSKSTLIWSIGVLAIIAIIMVMIYELKFRRK